MLKTISSWSIRVHLIILVIVAILPALAIIIFTGMERRQAAIEDAKRSIRQLTLSVATHQEQLTNSTRQLLMTLAQVPAIRERDVRACNQFLKILLKQNPCYASISIATPDGKVFASAPSIQPFSIAGRKYFKDVLTRKEFSVGEYVLSHSAGRPVLHFAYPVLDEGNRLMGIITAAFDLSYYGQSFATAKLPEGSALALTDSGGIRLYRHPDFEKYAGIKDLPEMITRMTSEEREGSFFAPGVDGKRRLYGFKRMYLTWQEKPDLFIRVGVSEAVVLSEANRNITRNIGILGFAALLAMVLAYTIGNFLIARPLNLMVKASKRIGRGDLTTRTELPHGDNEVGQLAGSFDEMASMLAVRESERKWAESRIEQLRLEREQILNSAGEGIVGLNAGGEHIFVNPVAAKMLGYDIAELIGRKSHPIHHHTRTDGSDYPESECPIYSSYREGKIFHASDELFWRKDGSHFPVEYTSTPIMENGRPAGAVLTFKDITERIRTEKMLRKGLERGSALLKLYEEASKLNEKELYDFTLELAVKLTDSVIGFFHMVSEDQQNVVLTSWNKEALEDCSAPFETHYPIDQAGNWVDCVRLKKPVVYNEFPRSPNRKGLPEGHVPIERFMSIPVVEKGRALIIFGVGNKSEPYDDHDVLQIQLVANELHKIMRQRKSDQDLRESEELHRMLAEKSMAGVYIVQNSKFKFLNANAASYAGYLPEELIGCDAMLIIHSEDRTKVKENAAAMLKGERTAPYEFRIMCKDGSARWIMESVTHIQYEGKQAVLGNSMDITEIIHAKHELDSRKALELSILDAIPHAVIGLENRKIIFANSHVKETFGWSPEELIGKTTRILYRSDEEYEDIGRSAYPVLLRQRTHSMECVCRRRDEQDIVCLLNGAVIGETLVEGRVVVVYEDITALKQTENDRRKMETQLRQAQKMEALGTLAGGIAHDFNNILGGIIGYAELYKDQVHDRPRIYHGLEEVLNASQRAKDLVQQILTFSRQREQERIPIKLSPIVKEVTKFMRASLPATIQIRHQIDARWDKIMADASQIHQVLTNLCTNAGHAMKDTGGILEITLEQIDINDDNMLNLRSLQPGLHLKLTVSDTGCGITEENIERIFEPYFTTKEIGEGTGLGLAVVHGIIKSHGGEIKVYSEVGKGTRFHVYLPLLKEQMGIDQVAQPTPLPRGKETILFVDDEKMLAQVGKLSLEKLGYEVVAETDPIKAVDLFKEDKDRFDLVITDKTMPKMTGFDLARDLKSVRPDVPVILCSGFQEKTDEAELSAVGISHFISKPIDIGLMAKAIRTVLKKNKDAYPAAHSAEKRA